MTAKNGTVIFNEPKGRTWGDVKKALDFTNKRKEFNIPCFYVISPASACADLRYIKIGKTGSLESRMREYARYFSDDFTIYHIRIFAKRKEDYATGDLRSSWADGFETRVKQQLKANKVRWKNKIGDGGVNSRTTEFYQMNQLKKILDSVGEVSGDLDKDMRVDWVPLRRSDRLKGRDEIAIRTSEGGESDYIVLGQPPVNRKGRSGDQWPNLSKSIKA